MNIPTPIERRIIEVEYELQELKANTKRLAEVVDSQAKMISEMLKIMRGMNECVVYKTSPEKVEL